MIPNDVIEYPSISGQTGYTHYKLKSNYDYFNTYGRISPSLKSTFWRQRAIDFQFFEYRILTSEGNIPKITKF